MRTLLSHYSVTLNADPVILGLLCPQSPLVPLQVPSVTNQPSITLRSRSVNSARHQPSSVAADPLVVLCIAACITRNPQPPK